MAHELTETRKCSFAAKVEDETLAAAELNETEPLVNEMLTLPMSASRTEAEIEAMATDVRKFFGA